MREKRLHIAGAVAVVPVASVIATTAVAGGDKGLHTRLTGFQEAIRAGVTYVNVHSATFPGGEIRGQLKN